MFTEFIQTVSATNFHSTDGIENLTLMKLCSMTEATLHNPISSQKFRSNYESPVRKKLRGVQIFRT
jgi:protein tyrosine/serine phosphatase